MEFREQIESIYQGDQGQRYQQLKHSLSELGYGYVARSRADKIAKYIRYEDNVLEYGVGMGWNLYLLKCRDKVGYDLTSSLRSTLQKHGIEFINNLKALQGRTFNVIICHHVLEHVANPEEVLHKIRELLTEGGQLLVFVPYEIERRYRHFCPNEPNHHLYSWNVQTMANLLKYCGLRIKEAKVGPFGYEHYAAVLAEKTMLGYLGFRILLKLLRIIKPVYEVRIIAEQV